MRKFAQIQIDIWNDTDFRNLTPAAQHLYLVLLSHPSLLQCGVGDWKPKRLTGYANGWKKEAIEAAAGELIEGRFIVIDEDTDEYLVRTYVRNGGLMKQPNLATNMARSLMEVGSESLRGVVTFELQRLEDDHPELNGFTADAVKRALKNPSVNPSDYPCGNPYRNPSGNPSGNPSPNPSGNPSVNPSERVPVTHRVTHQNDDSNPSGNPSPITSNWYIVTNNEVTNNSSKSGSNEEPEASSSDDEHGGSKTEVEPEPTNRYPDAFEEWWNLYPRKQGKRKALNEWRRATKRTTRQELNEKTQHFADFHNHQGTDKQYIPLPTTWLARDGWDDELIPRTTNSHGSAEPKSKSQRYIELGERMARELEAQEAQKPQPTGTKQLEPPF